MQRNSRIILSISIGLAIAISTTVTLYVTLVPENKLIEHEPIIIWGNEDFKNYNLKGEGTAKKPFLIQNFNITGESNYGIYIRNTSLHFIIQNCYLDVHTAGIAITNAESGTFSILNNICINNRYGIEIRNSDSFSIINNICNNNSYPEILIYLRFGAGISISDSSNFKLENNVCNNNIDYGILISNSESVDLYNNTCDNNLFSGISLYDSPNSIVANNKCNNNEKIPGRRLIPYSLGIYIVDSENTTITNNICSDNKDYGIYLLLSSDSTVEDNTCNGNEKSGIHISKSDNSNILRNNCDENYASILVVEALKGLIANNNCSQNAFAGIILDNSLNFTIQRNNISENEVGLYLNNTDFCEISYNLIKENVGYGVNLLSDSNNNTIHHNSFINNNLSGISQAFDESEGNTWYDENTNEGNFWTDHVAGDYAIDGPSSSYDIYPLNEEPVKAW